MKRKTSDLSRRAFIGSVAAAGAAAVSAGVARGQTIPANEQVTVKAPDGRLLRAGLIGCGGRGRGAAQNFLDAGPNLQSVALADLFPDPGADPGRLRQDQAG